MLIRPTCRTARLNSRLSDEASGKGLQVGPTGAQKRVGGADVRLKLHNCLPKNFVPDVTCHYILHFESRRYSTKYDHCRGCGYLCMDIHATKTRQKIEQRGGTSEKDFDNF